MYFNSLEFCLFFAIVYGLYFVLNLRSQNVLLLIASYVFYGWWDWRFLGLIMLSTVLDYFCGLNIESAESQASRRRWLSVSIVANLGILGFFKYYNFFVDNLDRVLGPLGLSMDISIAAIVLPVGISFYTFQTMSYTIDIYRGELKPTTSFLNFAVFVSYFPQLVAGPIERARVLLPQIEQKRRLKYQQIADGFRLILIGYFLKLVVADNMSPFTRDLFNSPEDYHGLNVLFGLYAAAFQILGDFAGYSSIARGISLLMGIRLMRNFDQPYLATNPSDFWRRWHISLSTWLRDYLYIPLGGNRGGSVILYRNLMITMVLGGLWHGAALNFVAWGIFHGGILIAHRLFQPTIRTLTAGIPQRVVQFLGIVFFFHVTCVGWLLFFVKRLSHVKVLLVNLIRPLESPVMPLVWSVLLLGGGTMAIEILTERSRRSGIDGPVVATAGLRLLTYGAAAAVVTVCGVFRSTEFIYFQF